MGVINNLFLIFIFVSITSCSSIKDFENQNECIVYKNGLIFGTKSLEINSNVAEWSGDCKGVFFYCHQIKIEYDQDKNVFIRKFNDYNISTEGDFPLGNIQNGSFKYNSNNPFEHTLSFSNLFVDHENKVVKRRMESNIVIKQTTDIIYRYNKMCTDEQAIIGSLVLGFVDQR